jgi:hypothetical protein
MGSFTTSIAKRLSYTTTSYKFRISGRKFSRGVRQNGRDRTWMLISWNPYATVKKDVLLHIFRLQPCTIRSKRPACSNNRFSSRVISIPHFTIGMKSIRPALRAPLADAYSGGISTSIPGSDKFEITVTANFRIRLGILLRVGLWIQRHVRVVLADEFFFRYYFKQLQAPGS